MILLKKILKIIGIAVFLLFLTAYIFFYNATAPKSNKKVLKEFQKLGVTPKITKEKYKTFEYRKVSVVNNTTFPTIIFVHGAIGSVLDFKRYMTDSLLLQKVNMIIYDRIGYNYKDENDVQESIAFEVAMLESIAEKLTPKKTILVGYSYGGPIILASKKQYKKVILLAPTVYSKFETMPWMLNLYKWNLTRWLIPPIWRQASKEKMTHKKDLENFEKNWHQNPNKVVSIHGDADWIVSYENSKYLETLFPNEQFSLIAMPEVGHGFVWSNFSELRDEFLNQLD